MLLKVLCKLFRINSGTETEQQITKWKSKYLGPKRGYVSLSLFVFKLERFAIFSKIT